MDIRERPDASFDYTFEAAKRFRLRKINGGLDARQDILGSILGFAREYCDTLVAPLSLRYVPGNFLRTYDRAFSVFDRRDCQRNVDQTAILALGNGFVMADPFPAPDASK
jgi:hypothetical protein